MNANQLSNALLRTLLIVAGSLLALWILIQLQTLIVYLIVGAILSLIGRPVVVFLKKRLKFSSFWASITTLTLYILILFGVVSLISPLVLQQSNNLSLLDIEALELKVNQLSHQLETAMGYKEDQLLEAKEQWISNALKGLDLNFIPQLINGMIQFLGNFAIAVFAVFFVAFFLLKDSSLLEDTVFIFVPKKWHAQLKNSLLELKNLLSRYFIGLILQITILLVIYTIVLVVFGVPNAFVIALLCALLNLVPYLGPVIGAILMAILTLTSDMEANFVGELIPKTLYVLLGFSLGQLVDNVFSQPFIFSNSVKSHPLEIFIVILMAGTLFGATGLIVAIPAYTAIKVILKTFLAENRIVKALTKDL
ncbi:MAG: AI-2E family transporter [Flavobacteriaceae bacterium]